MNQKVISKLPVPIRGRVSELLDEKHLDDEKKQFCCLDAALYVLTGETETNPDIFEALNDGLRRHQFHLVPTPKQCHQYLIGMFSDYMPDFAHFGVYMGNEDLVFHKLAANPAEITTIGDIIELHQQIYGLPTLDLIFWER